MEASSRASSRCFIFMYFLLPHWVPATWRSLAQTSIRAELPSGKLPTTRVRRRISRFSLSMTLLVRIRLQCSLGKSAVGQSLLNAIFYLLCGLFQLHSTQFLHHSFGLLPGCFLDLLGVDRFEHLGHNLYLGARRYRLRSYRAAWVSFSASASSSSLSVSSTLSRTNSFSCPFITSSFSCTIFSDIVCCLLSEWCVTTSSYQSSASHVSFSFCETYSTLS